MALERMEGRERKQLLGQLEQELDGLMDQVNTWGMKRVVPLLWMLDGVVDQMTRLGDKKGLETVGLAAARGKFTIDQVKVKAPNGEAGGRHGNSRCHGRHAFGTI